MIRTRRGLLALGAAAPFAARAQPAPPPPPGYPSKPVRLLIGFAPGGATDIAARLAAPILSELLGQQVVLENRSGAGGNVATEMTARAPADGYTLLMLTPGQVVTNPLMMRVPYDPERDITAIARMTAGQLVMVVPKESPFRDVRELLEAARARSRTTPLSYGTPGPGTSQHIVMEMLKKEGGFEATHVPYRGSGPAIVDLIGGKIDFMIDSVSPTLPHVRTGSLRAVAVTGERPHPDFPEAATLNSVVPGVVMTTWVGLGGPPDMPPAMVSYLTDVVRRAVDHPGFSERIKDLGGQSAWLGPRDFTAALSAERTSIGAVIRSADIRME
ncbi:Bug family tripartite tricarboxylate transporter substrate binding protein [Pseudoroseomonas ludipueritiae]|uniref:Tripartite tricarboxylate transporter substrate binding protein n=1 Tax=Pseudoroseomonas ludipueritiae TaxID=198093 RepID=A0ABR7R5Q5_9PROT|nr:tripartite tricarboxylate transporter substrate binding protein [Pseudoroseomonas ludipueritiae]MBC9176999.1 tripartite tricarboxylate transporter substrate binding protein [Pseudoroseomonas ludipueritiae]